MKDNKLDNPVWHSLNESHQAFSLKYGDALFYSPEYCVFGEQRQSKNISDAIASYAQLSPSFFVIGEKPNLPNSFNIQQEVACLQMTVSEKIDIVPTHPIIKLEPEHLDDVLALVAVAYPHFFQPKTLFLGSNYGIYQDGKLVAMTGERMKMHEYTEVSSVITHPDYTGRGYAKQLLAHTVNQIFDETKQPYLHVAKSNVSAIALYEKLGFQTRREITFWGIKAG